MPSINRIRVNNVKYNFGTQGYDDFSMRMYGRNTLYDLANGGGKSVLMLLLMQNLIPNCTLDDKQPIEKLFRDPSNTVIHSLIEWKLDQSDIKDGMRYMTTGFAAKKASGSEEVEEEHTAQIEYFNYVIFYRDYNKNDIINLPLEKDGEHISYKALKNYLHDLARSDKNMLVYIFDRKGEYQKFIAEYGLYESHWEIVRGINKTEGHVRTYFETNYKTTRRVIEDLLIEEIIEKAYVTKTSRETGKTESTARLLLTIQEELRTLSEKKKDIRIYDYEKELLTLLIDRIESFASLYQKKDEVTEQFGRIYITLENEKKNRENKLQELRNGLAESESEVREAEIRIELLKILKDIYEEEELKESIDTQKGLKKEADNNISMQKALLNEKLASREYKLLKDAETELAKLDSMKDDTHKKSDIYAVVSNIRRIIMGEIEKNSKKCDEIKLRLSEIDKESQLKNKELSEAYTEIAVLDNRREYLDTDIKRFDESYASLQDSLSNPVIGSPVSIIEKKQREIQGFETDIKETEERISVLLDEEKEAEAELKSILMEIGSTELKKNELESLQEEYKQVRDKRKAISSIYTGDASSDMTQVEDKLKDQSSELIVKLHEMKKRLTVLEKREKEIRNGRLMAPTRGVEKLQEYIATRHGASAMFGMDYVSSLPDDMKKELLTRVPGIAYGLVVEDLDKLMVDTGLTELDIDEQIVLYDKDTLSTISLGEEAGIGIVRHNKDFYINLSAVQSRLGALGDEMRLMEEDIRSSQSMLETLREDMDFVRLYIDKNYDSVETDLADTVKKLDELSANRNRLLRKESLSADELDKQRKKIEELTHEIEVRLGDIAVLNDIATAEDNISRLKKEKVDILEGRNSLTERTKKLETVIEELNMKRLEYSDRLKSVESESSALQAKWENRYSMYYLADDSFERMDQDLGSLELLFDQALGDTSGGRMALEKEKLLRDTLVNNIARATLAIEELGVDPQLLEEMDKKGELVIPGDELIQEIKKNSDNLQEKAKLIDKKLRELEDGLSRLSGKLEYARRRFAEKYGEESTALMESVREYSESYQDKTIDDIIRETDGILDFRKKELKNRSDAFSSYMNEEKGNEDILRLSSRIVQPDKYDLSELMPLSDMSSIRENFDQMLLSHDKLVKDIDRAKADMMKVKLKVYDSLTEMNRNELAASIRDDVVSPETSKEAGDLTDNLREVVKLIDLEKDRLEKSLVGMEKLKDSFIEECVERCLDVRSELDKLTRLSEITMDQKAVQMIRLTIPYVKDEYIKDRMAEYIDSVVAEMDKKETESDMQKFLNSSLSMKKLFSVIVTDMSKIRLLLYKRERIKEQSRYLKYEEAVGSTGQSQGIYIQFLISIINYIAGMYATGDTKQRSKTLFIDNPFGAAKDIYIWEPIFSLLKENNCQLIVPARGATPEITGRFDINYVLGQQMTGKRTTTVVTSFSSKTKGEELEYKELDYEQQSFDFI